jgi:phosphoglycerol geranylgeranyltransferase
VLPRWTAVAEPIGVRVGRVAALGRIGAELLGVETNPVPAWRHVTKVDPERGRRLPLLFPRYLRRTDAVAVGGSTGVTAANTEATFALLSAVDRPVFHEPSDPTHVTDRTREAAAFIAVPQVLNGSSTAIVGDLGAGIERVLEELAPAIVDERVPASTPDVVRDALAEAATSWLLATAVFEAYLVQNPDSAVAREAGVTPTDVLSPAEAGRRAAVADRHLRSPVVYVEYSGAFGGREAERVVRAVRERVSRARLWYGGGVASGTDARAMRDAGADAVVVGNAFHDVAREEAALFARAGEALAPDVSRADVARWLADESGVAVAETAATAYLSTGPTPSAEGTATDLLVDTVTTWFALSAAADRPTAADRDRIHAAATASASATAPAGGGWDDAETDAVRTWTNAALAAVRDPAADPLAPHLSPALTDGGTGDDGRGDGSGGA